MTNLIPLPDLQVVDGQPVVSSLTVAEHFAKPHADVLKTIRRISSDSPADFNEGNFSLVNYLDEKGELRPKYLLTRDAFSLVVMGFTGKKALHWKIRFIEAFNAMERELLKTRPKARALPPPPRPTYYALGRPLCQRLDQIVALYKEWSQDVAEMLQLEGARSVTVKEDWNHTINHGLSYAFGEQLFALHISLFSISAGFRSYLDILDKVKA